MSSKKKPLEFNGNWDLAPSIENTEHIQINEKYGLFINGKFIDRFLKNIFKTVNPSNGNLALIAGLLIKTLTCCKSARDDKGFGQKDQKGKYIFKLLE